MKPFNHAGLEVAFCEPVDKGNAPYPDFITGMSIEGDAIGGGGRKVLFVNISKELASDEAAIRCFAALVVKGQLITHA